MVIPSLYMRSKAVQEGSVVKVEAHRSKRIIKSKDQVVDPRSKALQQKAMEQVTKVKKQQSVRRVIDYS